MNGKFVLVARGTFIRADVIVAVVPANAEARAEWQSRILTASGQWFNSSESVENVLEMVDPSASEEWK